MFSRQVSDAGICAVFVCLAILILTAISNLPPAFGQSEVLSPTTLNVTITSADTEYSQALPAGCKYFTMQCRDATAVRWAYATGKVATPTAPYNTMKAGSSYSSPEKFQTGTGTLYFAAASGSKVVEIIAYQ